MKKREIGNKISGVAFASAMIAALFLSSFGTADSTGDLDAVYMAEVIAQQQNNCPCDISGSTGLQNPAAEYCTKMGYEYRTVKTEAGERGICVLPNGDEVNAWAFYRGECATDFSYCAKMGWPVAVKAQGDSYSDKCCTCSLPDGSKKTVSELLDLGSGDTMAINYLVDKGSNEVTVAATEGGLPESFDWRNKDGQDWVTPVKDQGVCGSCWAFAAVGTVEALYNIFTQDPVLDLDLSEQYLVSDCCYCGDCDGGETNCSLIFVRDKGIPDEACLPYIQMDCPCNQRCHDWSDRLYTIDATGSVSADIQAIRECLVDKGPLSAYMGIGTGSDIGGYFDEDGIYRCVYDNSHNHAVVIVGYDEAESCWIVKNSFGMDWGDEGYFKVGCNECGIENWVSHAALNHKEEIIYQSGDMDDSAGGDGDGDIEPGESIGMRVTLWNRSANTTFTDVRGTLTSTAPDVGVRRTIFSEDFEGSWPGNWTVGDWSYVSGEDYWGQSDYRASGGSLSAYCADVSDVSGQYYDNYMNAFMVRDVDLSAYASCLLSYEYWLSCESQSDRFYAGYFDGSWHWVQRHTGISSGWASAMIQVPATAEQIGFLFSSNYDVTEEGAYVDDVVLTGYCYAPDPYISISDDSEDYGDIPSGNWVTSPDEYGFVIDPACPAGHVVTFNLNVTASNGGPWINSFTSAILTPPDVCNVSAVLRTDGSGIVDISYDVSANETAHVSVDYWDILSGWHHCTEITGDVGPGIDTGTDKAVVWNARTQLRKAHIPCCKARIIATGSEAHDSAESNTFTLDINLPEIIYEQPSGLDISTDSSIIIAFNEPMDTPSAQSAFFISPAVVGSFHWTGNRMAFSPTTNLADDTLYTVTMHSSARDSMGNPLDGNKNGIPEGSPIDDYTWTFDTGTGSCFIATAAYGTAMAEEIQILRDFRDQYLLANPVGQTMVELYYSTSPPVADFIAEHPSLKPMVRIWLAPVVTVSGVVVNTTATEKVTIIGLLILTSAIATIWVTRHRGRADGSH